MTGSRRVAVYAAFVVSLALCRSDLGAKECSYVSVWDLGTMRFALENIPQYQHDPTKPKHFENPVWRQVAMDLPPSESAIFASGAIVSGKTRMEFEEFLRQNPSLARGTLVVLDSPGGDVDEALAIGKVIRDRGFDTAVGSRSLGRIQLLNDFSPYSIEAGACLSACTFTFLGGVNRRVHDHDLYGVHRFHPAGKEDPGSDIAQRRVGELLEYVRRMGVDQRLIEDMSAVGPATINSLDFSRLVELRVVTSASPLKDDGQGRIFSCN